MQATVGDLMTKEVFPISAEMPLCDALQILLSRGTDEMYVVDGKGNLAGVITDYEILKAQCSADLSAETVGRWMNSAVPTVAQGTPVESIATLFRNSNYKQIAVIEKSKIAGLIRRHDVMRFLNEVRCLNTTDAVEEKALAKLNAVETEIPSPVFFNKQRSPGHSFAEMK